MGTDWSKLVAKVHKSQMYKINRLRSQVDSTATKVASLPESLPQIDWDTYKAKASDPKMVEELERAYRAFKLEPPKAPKARMDYLAEAQRADEEKLKKFLVLCQSYVDSSKVLKKKFEKMIPIRDMGLEDWSLTFPLYCYSIENPGVSSFGRSPGLTLEEMRVFEQPDPLGYSTKTAWKDWEERKRKFYT